MIKVWEYPPDFSVYHQETGYSYRASVYFGGYDEELDTVGSKTFMNVTSSSVKKIDLPTEKWINNYKNKGFYQIKNIVMEELEDVYYDIWMLTADITDEEVGWL